MEFFLLRPERPASSTYFYVKNITMYIIDKTSLLSLYSCYSKYAVYGSTAGTGMWWNNGY